MNDSPEVRRMKAATKTKTAPKAKAKAGRIVIAPPREPPPPWHSCPFEEQPCRHHCEDFRGCARIATGQVRIKYTRYGINESRLRAQEFFVVRLLCNSHLTEALLCREPIEAVGFTPRACEIIGYYDAWVRV
jgi:hypothetical protein